MVRDLEKALGKSAEFLLKEFFEKKGYEFHLSEDTYDGRKDATLIVNGNEFSLESKLESLFRKFNSFTVPITSDYNSGVYRNQLSKCVNVDILIFCQRPSIDDRVLRIYRAPPVGQRYFEIKQNSIDKRYVAHFFVDTMKLIGTITDNDIVNKYIIRKG